MPLPPRTNLIEAHQLAGRHHHCPSTLLARPFATDTQQSQKTPTGDDGAMDPLEEAPWADAATSGTSQSTSQHNDVAAASTGASTSTADGASSPLPAAGSASLSTGAPSGARASRLTPRRLVAQPTRLQAVEDDPLGPLGASTSSSAGTPGPLSGNLSPLPGAGAGSSSPDTGPPAPPKEVPLRPAGGALQQQNQSQQQQRQGGPPDPHRIDNDDADDDRLFDRGPRVPPPVTPAQPGAGRAGGVAQSVSVEQAAKPSFWISVGDPHKVGDMTGSHIVYSVRTKVRNFQRCLDHWAPIQAFEKVSL